MKANSCFEVIAVLLTTKAVRPLSMDAQAVLSDSESVSKGDNTCPQ